MPSVTLENRARIAITGEDAEHFLQNLITTDLSNLPEGEIWPGALLTPQGKILFDFLIGRQDGGFLIELAGDNADAFIRRLTLYRLRAKVNFERLEGSEISVIWGVPQAQDGFLDHRFDLAGVAVHRVAGPRGSDHRALYDALRFEHGIVGGGEDGPLGDYFPHDLLMDKNGGLSFKKGCYVGQEVVSRMQHRSTARRRVARIRSDASLIGQGAVIATDGKEVGTLIGSQDRTGLAVVRIDKVGAALARGHAVLVEGQPVSVTLPVWAGLSFPTDAEEA